MVKSRQNKLDFIVDVAYLAVIVALVVLAIVAVPLFMPFLFALLLVAMLNPLIRKLHKSFGFNKRIVSISAIVLLYIIAVVIIAGLIMALVFVSKQALHSLPLYYVDVLEPAMDSVNEWLVGLVGSFSPDALGELSSLQSSISTTISDTVSSLSSKGISYATAFIRKIPAFFIALIFTVLLSLFMSIQYDEILESIKSKVTQGVVDKAEQLTQILKGTVFQYFKAILKLMVITFIELCIGLFILGADHPIAFAAGIAIFDALPVFGTGGIMIPWVIIELVQGNFSLALGLAILYAIITVVRNFIEPKVVGDELNINPIISLISIYVGLKTFGILGMILFPILASVFITLYKNKFFENTRSIKIFRPAEASEGGEPERPAE